MKFQSVPIIYCAAVGIVAALLSIVSANAQTEPHSNQPAADKPPTAEQVFRNVQVLRGISVKEFLETMGFFVAATPFSCGTCHGYATGGNWTDYAQDTPMKQTTRKMILMTNALNRTYFAGARKLTCYSCHYNADRPRTTPSLAELYSSPAAQEPDRILQQDLASPSADEIFDKYLQAIGGAARLTTLTTFVAKGTYQGYDDPEKRPVEIYGKAPNQFSQVVHGYNGYATFVDDGRSAWVRQSEREAPLPLLALAAGDLDGAHLESELFFPARIKQFIKNLRVGRPISGVLSIRPDSLLAIGVDDRELTVIQGTTVAGNNVKLYFDMKTALLVRMVRYTNLPVGSAPTEIDYSDYRSVSGMMLPFRITKTWVDGRSVTELTSIELNVPIAPKKFAKPAA